MDWTGNKNSAYVCNGASNHSDKERQSEDYYATEPHAVELLLQQESFSHHVWEPAVGGGHMANVLKAHGYDVFCSDIIDRGYPDTHIINFLERIPDGEGNFDIITNPPYKFAQEFVEQAIASVSDAATAVAYAWYVWEKGFNGNPIIKWI